MRAAMPGFGYQERRTSITSEAARRHGSLINAHVRSKPEAAGDNTSKRDKCTRRWSKMHLVMVTPPTKLARGPIHRCDGRPSRRRMNVSSVLRGAVDNRPPQSHPQVIAAPQRCCLGCRVDWEQPR